MHNRESGSKPYGVGVSRTKVKGVAYAQSLASSVPITFRGYAVEKAKEVR